MIRDVWRRVWHQGPEGWGVTAAAVTILSMIVVDVWLPIDYKVAANISLLMIAVLVNAFTLLYFVRSKWWTNRIGRIYLAKCLVLSAVLDQIALVLWWDADYPGRQYIRFFIYTMGAVVYVPMLLSLWREQQNDRRGGGDQ